MAYDLALANRIRKAFSSLTNVKEQQMMGGIVFMVKGKMCVGVYRMDSLMLRCDPERTEELLLKKGAKRFTLKGKPLKKGWLIVSPEAIKSEKDLNFWINNALDYNKTLTKKKNRSY
jgi:TfoX/Sxy family transcriptional regulator of competence genes